MNKQEYIQLRATLDFRLRYRWLIGHLAIDGLLAGLPVLFLLSRHESIEWSGITISLGLLSALSLATLYFRSFSMMHEAVHGLISTNRRVNDLVGLIYGSFALLPFAQWREIHLLHHYWSGNVEKDPVRRVTLIFKQKPGAFHKITSALWPTWFPILSIIQFGVFWSVCVSRFKQKMSVIAFVGITLPLVFWCGVLFASGLSLSALVILPSIILYFALVEVVNFPHHTDLPQYEGDTKFSLWDQHLTARSCFYPRMLEKLVLLNFNYHIEHHLYPTLPWYRLKDLSTVLREKIPIYHHSVGNEWIRRNRKRPLKDVCLSQSVNEESKAAV